MKRKNSKDFSEEEQVKPTSSEKVQHKAKKAKLKKRNSKVNKTTTKLDSSTSDNNGMSVDDSDDESASSSKEDNPTNKQFGIEEKKGDPFNLGIAHFNIQHLVIDEICLEGLDGITFEALWKRMSVATQFKLPFSNAIQKYVFEVIKSRDDINFYCLEEPRNELIIYEKCDNVDYMNMVDIYPFRGITAKNIMGSCTTFDTRKDITSKAKRQTLEELESQYGSRLVMVATQRIRLKSIVNKLMDPTVELSPNQYCMMERIARSRYHGEVTHGKMSLQIITKDAKHLFYNRKILRANFLIMKQPFYVQTCSSSQVNAILLHSPRFYNKQKTRTQIMTEQIVEVLRSAPTHKMEHAAIKEIFGNTKPLNKLCKMQEFQKFVKYDVNKYRDLYPNATPNEWKVKSHGGEKVIRTLNLINPLVNVAGAWNEEEPKEESSDEEDENEYCPNVPVLHQIYQYVKSSGLNGRSIKEMTCNRGLGFYTVRSAIKQQVTKNYIVGVKIDIGRSRYIKYHSNSTDIDLKDDESMVIDEPMDDLEEKSSQFIADLLGVDVSCLNSTSNSGCETEQRIEQKKENYEKISVILSSQLETPTNVSLNDNDGINLCYSSSLKKNIKTKVTGEELFLKIQKLKKESDLNNTKLLNSFNYKKWCTQTFFMVKSVLKYFNHKILIVSPDVNKTATKIKEVCTSHLKDEGKILTSKDIISLPSTSSSKDVQLEKTNDVTIASSSKVSVKRKAESIESSAVKRMKLDILRSESLLIARMYMGPNPTEVYKQTDKDNIETTILVSSTPEEFQSMKYKYPYLKENNLTQKTINRLNCILKMVREQHVVIDIKNLKQLILSEEIKEGYKTQVDAKSIYRILTRLAMSGDIKILLVNLKLFKKRRHIFIVVEPFINFDNSIIQSSIEKTKLRFHVDSKRKRIDSVKVPVNIKKSTHKNKKVLYPNEKLHTTSIKCILPYKYNPKASQAYGKRAKFAKMRILHEFMYYLIYDFSNERSVNENSDSQDSPIIYHQEVGWKMFVPPLPKQINWSDGWALTSDIIFRIPISILLKIHNVPFVIPELKAILAHPIKQHYLVKNLPINIRNVILYRRKYISSIFDILTRLCYIGLMQFGPKQYFEKDQTMIYLNRKASLLDTIKSKPGYHLIEQKDYPKLEFVFTSKEIVESYWFEMLNICMSTKLGIRNAVVGAYIICEDISKKAEMLDVVTPQSVESVLVRDNGNIPGDGLGAAGLDSTLWAHLRRNWTITQDKGKTTNQKHGSNSVANVVKERKPQVKKKRRVEVRKVMPRKDIKTDPIKYDEIDRKLMFALKQRRPPWTEEEEKILYICKIVALFLSPTHSKQGITSQVIRDVCHTLYPKSRNKTSQACLRKTIAIFDKCEQQKYLHKVSKNLCVAPYVRKYFQNTFNVIQSSEVFPVNRFASEFVYLVIHFFENQQEIQHIFENIAPLYNLRIKVNKNNKIFSHPTFERIDIGNSSVQVLTYDSIELNKTNGKVKEASSMLATFPKVENDITAETIKSLIQVGIENLHEFDIWRFQLYLLYDSYPSELVRRAETELKDIRMISIPKTAKLKSQTKKILPAFSKLYQFSNYYLYRRAKRVKFPPRIFTEAHEMFLEILKQKDNFVNFKSELLMDYFKQGHSVGLAELAVFLPITITLDIPKEVLELNTNVDDHMELIRELAIRYKDMLSQLKEDVSANKKSNQDESEKVRYICRKPMLRRFIKSWFISDEDDEESNEIVEEPVFVENNDTEDIENTNTEKEKSSIPITFDNFEGFEHQLEVLLSSNKDLPENENLFDNTMQLAEENVEMDYQQTIVVSNTVLEECTPNQLTQVEESTVIDVTDSDCNILPNENQNNEKEKLNLIKINLKQFEQQKDTVTDARLEYLLNDNLTIEEIMEEMVKDCPEEERKIPKATNLIRLLINSPELDNSNDDKRMDRLRDHFVIKSPSTKLHISSFENSQFNCLESQHQQICKKLLHKIETSILISNEIPSDEDIKIKFESLGVTIFDIRIILNLVTFVSEKLVLGASMKDITDVFVNFESIKLSEVLQVLTDINVFLRMGINYIVYVHSDYKNPWLIKTSTLTEMKSEIHRSDVSQMSKMMPWSRIDGSLNLKAFNSWFLTVFGLCLDNCEGSLCNVITECSFLKPVEVYYLVECLQELGCIQMVKYNYETVNLLSTTTIFESVPADVTVPFEDVYLEVLDFAIIKFGAFINKDLKEYDFSNENSLDYGTF